MKSNKIRKEMGPATQFQNYTAGERTPKVISRKQEWNGI